MLTPPAAESRPTPSPVFSIAACVNMLFMQRFSAWRRNWSVALSFLALAAIAPPAKSHPVPRRCHDRTIILRLAADTEKSEIEVVVEYRLEVDEFTVVFDDLPALGDKVELSKLRTPKEFYDTFTRSYAPILAANLIATLDGQPLEFACTKLGHSLRDENGAPLDHLRCDLVFRAKTYFKEHESSAGPAGQHRFTFREGNYELEEGRIRLSLRVDPSIVLVNKVEPDAALKERPTTDLKPGDDAKLRNASAAFTLPALFAAAASAPGSEAAPSREKGEQSPFSSSGESRRLLTLLLDSQQGFWALLLVAAFFGAAHALTPGHGKTLVAAYLIGERGTAGHALLLGLITTLTHTGTVIALSILLLFVPKLALPAVETLIELVGGLLVAGMGVWLLLRRLAGGADHFHLGGHGHHHHHDQHGHDHHHDHSHPDHYHDEQGHVHSLPADSAPLGWWGLIVMGVSGGIIPCWDAILMLGFAISAQRAWLGLPLLLAFSAGLASVLIAIGIGVVYLKGFASSRFGDRRLVRALPLISAALVTLMGLWLCYDSALKRTELRGPRGELDPGSSLVSRPSPLL